MTTTSVADLVPDVTPDHTLTDMRFGQVIDMLDDSLLGDDDLPAPYAHFTGVAFTLGVWLCADQQTYAVAPSWVTAHDMPATFRADVQLFTAEDVAGASGAYTRACLWALRQAAQTIENEERG